MDIYGTFVTNLYKFLLGVENSNNNIIKKHVRKLDLLGEFSVNSNVLKRFNSTNNLADHIQNVKTASLNWCLNITKYAFIEDTFHLHLDRASTHTLVISYILKAGNCYSMPHLNLENRICVNTDPIGESLSTITLSELRVMLIKSVIDRLLSFPHSYVNNLNSINICITHKSKKDQLKSILCAPVLSSEETELKAVDLYNKRTVHMRLMAEHKYGLRITFNTDWRYVFSKLGEAAVAIELLQVKPKRPLVCKLNDFSSCSKGASFILYNCARLATLLKEFQNKVESKTYPLLPGIENIDFGLLTQPEEWEITYGYLLQFPTVVHNCIKDILECNIKIHNLCHHLSSMCSVFSVYYQRVRILTEPREHLFSVLHARIYLIKAIEIVLHNGLYILGIEPVSQM